MSFLLLGICEHRKKSKYSQVLNLLCKNKKWFWCICSVTVQLSVREGDCWKNPEEEKKSPRVEQVHFAMNSFGTQSNEECWWGIQAAGVSWAKSGVWDSAGSFLLASHSLGPHSLTHSHSQIKTDPKYSLQADCSGSRMLQMWKCTALKYLDWNKVMITHFQRTYKSLCPLDVFCEFLYCFSFYSLAFWRRQWAPAARRLSLTQNTDAKCVFC